MRRTDPPPSRDSRPSISAWAFMRRPATPTFPLPAPEGITQAKKPGYLAWSSMTHDPATPYPGGLHLVLGGHQHVGARRQRGGSPRVHYDPAGYVAHAGPGAPRMCTPERGAHAYGGSGPPGPGPPRTCPAPSGPPPVRRRPPRLWNGRRGQPALRRLSRSRPCPPTGLCPASPAPSCSACRRSAAASLSRGPAPAPAPSALRRLPPGRRAGPRCFRRPPPRHIPYRSGAQQ